MRILGNLLLSVALIGVLALWVSSFFPTAPYSSEIDFVEESFTPASPDQLPLEASAEPITLLFAGDVMQHRRTPDKKFSFTYSGLRQLIGDADLAIANLEFPVDRSLPSGPPPVSVRFNGSPAHLAALGDAGFDVLITANNHAFDQGLDGMKSTIREIEAMGLSAVGTARNLEELSRPRIFEVGPIQVALYGYTYTVNYYQDASGEIAYPPRDLPVFMPNFSEWQGPWREQGLRLFGEHAQKAREAGADFLVAYCHWGDEWHLQPTTDQQRAAHDLVDSGFDLVVGAHGHVLQGPEIYKERLIVYSLGTLFSDFQPWQARTSALLAVQIGETPAPQIVDFTFYPAIVNSESHRIDLLAAAGDGGEEEDAMRLAKRILGPAVVESLPSGGGS